jgi:hypothetical protein
MNTKIRFISDASNHGHGHDQIRSDLSRNRSDPNPIATTSLSRGKVSRRMSTKDSNRFRRVATSRQRLATNYLRMRCALSEATSVHNEGPNKAAHPKIIRLHLHQQALAFATLASGHRHLKEAMRKIPNEITQWRRDRKVHSLVKVEAIGLGGVVRIEP